MQNTLTWERSNGQLAKRQSVGMFKSIEVREGEIGLHYTNGILKEEIVGKRTNWSPLSHDEVVWVSLAPFEIHASSFAFVDTLPSTIQIYASMKISNPRLFVESMLHSSIASISDIQSWLTESFKDVIRAIIYKQDSSSIPTNEEMAEIKNYLSHHAEMVGLKSLIIHYPEYAIPEAIVKARERLFNARNNVEVAKVNVELAQAKQADFSARIEGILNALERIQKPDQEIKLKAIEALKEWAKKPHPNFGLYNPQPSYPPYPAGYPQQYPAVPTIIPTDSDEAIVKKLIETFEKDSGSNKFVEALRNILIESDYLGIDMNRSKNEDNRTTDMHEESKSVSQNEDESERPLKFTSKEVKNIFEQYLSNLLDTKVIANSVEMYGYKEEGTANCWVKVTLNRKGKWYEAFYGFDLDETKEISNLHTIWEHKLEKDKVRDLALEKDKKKGFW